MKNKTLAYSVWLILSISFLLHECVAENEDLLGLHEMVNSIWMGSPGASERTTVPALDGMLILLNSRKLHRRQVPGTCPYCPVNFPCTTGCPNALPTPVTPCSNDCASTIGSPGPSGPAGVPGVNAPPLFNGKYLNGCPGREGPPGYCVPGSEGPAGIPGIPGTCPRTNVTNTVDLNLLRSTFRAYYQCNLPRQKCGYKIPELLERLRSIEWRLEAMVDLKKKLQIVTNDIGALRVKYFENRKPGPPGPAGIQGKPGMKGMPGYEGMIGKCRKITNVVPLVPGRPGVPGPKGDPGIPGDQVCDCDGAIGDRGYTGAPSGGLPGEKGFKGQKGDQYIVTRRADGSTMLGING